MHRRMPARLGLALLTSMFLLAACASASAPPNGYASTRLIDEVPDQ
jgi:hypothetical protein